MSKLRFLLSAGVCCCAVSGYAQTKITGKVLDFDTKKPVVGAVVALENTENAKTVTDPQGCFSLPTMPHKRIVISCLGYQRLVTQAQPDSVYMLRHTAKELHEVVVTAQETKGITGASVIGRQAMEHLQPSSFADLMELLPGGRAADPQLTTPNAIHIREAIPNNGEAYATSSLGTGFVIDGAPVSNNANMQYLAGSWEQAVTGRDFTNRGVDMRTISTDDIEKVEVVRGIPSVEYGDLTSGLVKIERKKGGNDWQARLKADMDSKLFYLAKGFQWGQNATLNLSADYLDAKEDPRNSLENYHRLTLSTRFTRRWLRKRFSLNLSTNIDYTGSFDKEKNDPDMANGRAERYKASYNRIGFMTNLSLAMRRRMWFRSLAFTLSGSYAHDLLSRTRLVQLSRMTAATTTTAEGESDAVLLPYTYYATQDADGKPFNLFMRLNAKFRVPSSWLGNTLLIGGDWTLDKNYGGGQEFDGLHPLYPGTSARPRKLSATPAISTLSFYAEETLKFPLGAHRLEITAGMRAQQLLNLPRNYAMHGKWYVDPRVNMGWTLPQFSLAGLPTRIRFTAGVGRHTKNPTLEYLHPQPLYLDIVQLNYYHTTPDYRRINLMTYVIDPSNPDIMPARNLKWELGTDVTLAGNRLSITLFRENMRAGFRTNTIYQPFRYRQYDASNINPATLTAPPDVANLPYQTTQELFGRTAYTNGSRTFKRGLEYTLASKRIPSLHTRVTINGAWFKTMYRNSQQVMYRPGAVVNNRQIEYVGIYRDNDGVKNEMANTNFTFDTDLPRLRLGFSVSAQCLWFTSTQRLPLSNTPSEYLDAAGNRHAWQETDAQDAVLRFLVRNHTDSEYQKYTEPFSMNVNLKVTKRLLNDRLSIAMFCNRILDITPDYTRNGTLIRRHVKPYFGLETNFKL